MIFGLIMLNIMSMEVEGVEEDLMRSARAYGENRGLEEGDMGVSNFMRRGNNFWINYLYYEKKRRVLEEYFEYERKELVPRYPLVGKVLMDGLGYDIFPPSNLVELVIELRKSLGGGILMVSAGQSLGSRNVVGEDLGIVEEEYRKHLSNLYELLVEYEMGGEVYVKEYGINYPRYKELGRDLMGLESYGGVKVMRLELRYNEEAAEYMGFKEGLGGVLIERINLSGEGVSLEEGLREIRGHLLKVYRLSLRRGGGRGVGGVEVEEEVEDMEEEVKEYRIRFDNFLMGLRGFEISEGGGWEWIDLKENEVLKYKINTREYLGEGEVSDRIKKGFILVEDDYYYVEPRGIDPIGLMKASYDYIFRDGKKGNASITEQIYEMYLGQQKKGPWEKLEQILGAMYLSYYTKDVDGILDLYVQSIPGSYWKDHNYGVQGISRSYLGKDSLEELNLRELAWLTRLGLLPNVFGQDYIRFSRFGKFLERYGYEIWSEGGWGRFMEEVSGGSLKVVLEGLGVEGEDIGKLRAGYKETNRRIDQVLKEFFEGNEFMEGMISEEEYRVGLEEEVRFWEPVMVNKYQEYTDQTKKDLLKYFGGWILNSGLELEVAFDKVAQGVLEKNLELSVRTVHQYKRSNSFDYKLVEEEEEKDYGGGALLVKTNGLKDGEVKNEIIAIASRHVGKKGGKNEGDYFNWVVDGRRHFGSIFKWLVLMLYLDRGGTLKDMFYDIPRDFHYEYEGVGGRKEKKVYRPNNWRRKDELYGYFTYRKQDNVYNFIQSKNNTFVRIAELIGLEEVRDFLNDLAGYNEGVEVGEGLKFKASYPLVLGSQGLSSILFAQLNAVIANKGLKQDLVTLQGIVEGGVLVCLDLGGYRRRVVSRESAEMAFYAGYLNTFSGTAKRFIKGGVGKTGSSVTDVSFLAMTGRTREDYMGVKGENDLLNHNLLYLVNIGVNEGKIDEGLYGGTVAALNARGVFVDLLGNGEGGFRHKISGDFKKYFSDRLLFKGGVPMLEGVKEEEEEDLSEEEIEEIREGYESRLDEEFDEEYGKRLAKVEGLEYGELDDEMKGYYKNKGAIERYYRGSGVGVGGYRNWLIWESESGIDGGMGGVEDGEGGGEGGGGIIEELEKEEEDLMELEEELKRSSGVDISLVGEGEELEEVEGVEGEELEGVEGVEGVELEEDMMGGIEGKQGEDIGVGVGSDEDLIEQLLLGEEVDES